MATGCANAGQPPAAQLTFPRPPLLAPPTRAERASYWPARQARQHHHWPERVSVSARCLPGSERRPPQHEAGHAVRERQPPEREGERGILRGRDSLSARGGDGGGRAGEALGRPSRGPRGRLWCYCRRSGGVPGGKERLLACLRGGGSPQARTSCWSSSHLGYCHRLGHRGDPRLERLCWGLGCSPGEEKTRGDLSVALLCLKSRWGWSSEQGLLR